MALILLLNNKRESMIKVIIEWKETEEHYFDDIKSTKEYLSTFFNNNIIDEINDEKYFTFSTREYINDEWINIMIEKIVYTENKIPKAWSLDSGVSLLKVFPEDAHILYDMLNDWIKVISEEECCIDSERIGLKNNEESMKEYSKFITCCGSNEIEVEVNGKIYVIGCNYGH
jgi:hypothetical protein